MVLLRMIGGDEIHICNSLMHRLAKDKSIGRFKKSASGSYTHVSNSITEQNRLKMMIAQDICDDASEHDTEIDNDDLEHIVRKVFNHVQDVSRVDAVINALKHVNLEQCMKQLEFQYGIDKVKLFLLDPRIFRVQCVPKLPLECHSTNGLVTSNSLEHDDLL